MSITVLRQLLMKEAVKKSAGSSGIMTINKNIAKDVDKLLQKYINDALAQGVDLDTLSPEQLKMIVAINSKPTNRVISGSSPEGKAITEKLFGKKGGDVNIYSKQYIDNLDKEIIDSGLYTKKEWTNLSDELKEARRRKFDPNYDDAMEGMVESNVVDMTGKNIDTSQGIIGGKSVKELMESGQVQKGTDNIKISEKITDREMFKNSNLNKEPISEKFIDYTIQNMNKMKPIDAMKEANSVIGRKGPYKDLTPEQSKKILQDTEDHIFERDIPIDPEDMARGGRAGHYTGGMVDVEPNLSDIGHGSDALMARTRLVSPDGQATTSTGLNYLLAEDNDNIRVPFKVGGDAGRRAFLKLLATLGGGVAAAKSGILGLGGKETSKQVAKEVVKSAGSGNPPPYFFKLVEKIKTLGDETLATQDKAIAKKYKDYVMEEDFAGNIEIIKKGDDIAGNKIEDVYMRYTVDEVPLRGKKGSSKVEEYEEFTARPDAEGKMKDVEPGVPDEVVQEGTMFEDNMTEFGMTKKADGGRIGFSGGNLAKLLAGKKITGSSGRFLEKIFGKGSLNEISKRDPEMHRGLLEVVEMFRSRDKAGLVEYMQNFLPHMSKKEIQAFIKGDAVDAAGQGKYGLGDMQGQLIRLGSGRDYKGKLEAMQKLENAKKLDTLDVTEEMIRKPNASGGIQTMLGE